MRLSTEDLRHGWRHPRRLVRDVVASYFEHSFTADSATTREATASVEEFGWRGFLSWGYKFTRLPLVDDRRTLSLPPGCPPPSGCSSR